MAVFKTSRGISTLHRLKQMPPLRSSESECTAVTVWVGSLHGFSRSPMVRGMMRPELRSSTPPTLFGRVGQRGRGGAWLHDLPYTGTNSWYDWSMSGRFSLGSNLSGHDPPL